MSSPCQASWPHDDDGNMTTIHNNADDLQSFFRTYDELIEQARSVTLDQTVRDEALLLQTNCQSSLTARIQAVQSNEDMIKEQTDRIALVSTHWFYGNSVYQPQLWLRGGCAGKLARAQRKLTEAEQIRPQLRQEKQLAQQEHDTAAERLRQCQIAYEQSFSAEEQRCRRQEELVQKYPSTQLHDLLHVAAEHQHTIEAMTSRSKEMGDIGRAVDKAERQLESALSSAQRAETALKQVERLERENNNNHSYAARESRSSSSASRGTPVVVVQHHHNHRSNNPRRPGSVHSQGDNSGGQQTVPVQRQRQRQRSHGQSHHSSTTGIVDHHDGDTARRNNHLLQMERQQRLATEALRQAHGLMKEGSNTLEGAVDELIRYIRCHGATTTTRPPSRLIVLGGSLANDNTQTASRIAIQDLRLQVTQLQSVREEHAVLVREVQDELRLVRTTAADALQRHQGEIASEKTRIVDALREQTRMRSGAIPTIGNPSAPPAENDAGSSSYFGTHEPDDDASFSFPSAPPAAAPAIVVDAETPVLIPTEHWSTAAMKDIPFATVAPLAPPDIWDDNNHRSASAVATSGRGVLPPPSEEAPRRSFAMADRVK
jgi:hypothetical protein